VIVVENLNIDGMVENHHLSRSISDSGWGIFLRQLEYKSLWYGSQLIKVSRFFPSTKMCSRCGYVKETLPLSERTFHCPRCGLSIDRDMNAAKNLASYALPGVPREVTPVEIGSAAESPDLSGSRVGTFRDHKSGVYEHPVVEARILRSKIP